MKKILYTLFCLLLCGCYPLAPTASEKHMRKNFFFFTPDKNIGIEDKINIDGYYVNIDSQSVAYGTIFYSDGTHGTFFFKNQDSSFSPNEPYMDLTQKAQLSRRGFYSNAGTYKVNGDTIESNSYFGFNPNIGNPFLKEKFKIIDRNHICLVQSTCISYNGKEQKTGNRNEMLVFVPVSKLIPETGIYGKTKKWFWKDKEDWKKYVRQMKQEHKLMKQKKKEMIKQKKRQATQ